MRIHRFEDVVAWQKAKELNIYIHSELVNIRDFTFRDQIFRASLSIMNNIAEGFDRGTDRELKQFLIISRGSTAEVRSMLVLARDLNYLPRVRSDQLIQLTEEISKLLSGFIKKIDYRLMTNDWRLE